MNDKINAVHIDSFFLYIRSHILTQFCVTFLATYVALTWTHSHISHTVHKYYGKFRVRKKKLELLILNDVINSLIGVLVQLAFLVDNWFLLRFIILTQAEKSKSYQNESGPKQYYTSPCPKANCSLLRAFLQHLEQAGLYFLFGHTLHSVKQEEELETCGPLRLDLVHTFSFMFCCIQCFCCVYSRSPVARTHSITQAFNLRCL